MNRKIVIDTVYDSIKVVCGSIINTEIDHNTCMRLLENNNTDIEIVAYTSEILLIDSDIEMIEKIAKIYSNRVKLIDMITKPYMVYIVTESYSRYREYCFKASRLTKLPRYSKGIHIKKYVIIQKRAHKN